MKTRNQTITINVLPLFTVAAIVFITLKLAGVIQWPWLWVLSPIWMPVAFAFALFSIFISIALLVRLITRTYGRRNFNAHRIR